MINGVEGAVETPEECLTLLERSNYVFHLTGQKYFKGKDKTQFGDWEFLTNYDEKSEEYIKLEEDLKDIGFLPNNTFEDYLAPMGVKMFTWGKKGSNLVHIYMCNDIMIHLKIRDTIKNIELNPDTVKMIKVWRALYLALKD